MPPKKKTATPESLETSLFKAADKLRGKMDAAVYKHVVLGLIFLKYVSDTFMVRHNELARLVDDPESDYYMPNDAAKKSVREDRDEYTAEGVFWIPEGHRWDELRKAAKQPDIGKQVDAAMEAIERENPALKGVLPKNYTQRELAPEAIGGLIDTFSRQDLAAEEFKDLDVLGRVYEYFLGQFASKEGRRVLHAALDRPTPRGDAPAVPRPCARPSLRLGRHVRPGRQVCPGPRWQPDRPLGVRPRVQPDHMATR